MREHALVQPLVEDSDVPRAVTVDADVGWFDDPFEMGSQAIR